MNKSITNNGRNDYIDIVKSVAIILVVIGHCIQCGSGSLYYEKELFFDNVLFKFIYSFHMPLFMLLSGFLFGYKKNWKVRGQIKKKALQLLIPIFAWSIIPFAIFLVESYSLGLGMLLIIKKYVSISVHNLWFLWAVFLLSCTVVIVRKFGRDNIAIYLILWILSNFVVDKYNIFLYAYMYPFFVLGYLYNVNDLNTKLFKWAQSNHAIILLGIAYVLLLCFFSYDKYIYTSYYSVFGKENVFYQLAVNAYRFIIGLVGSIFVLLFLFKIFQYNKGTSICKILCNIGRNSLGIYVVSVSIFNEILLSISASCTGFTMLRVFIESLIVLVLSYYSTFFIKKFRILNILLLGGRV